MSNKHQTTFVPQLFWLLKLMLLLSLLSSCVPNSASQTPVPQPTETLPAPVAATVTPAIATATHLAKNDQALLEALRNDTGYIVLLRHAQTVPGTGDPPGFRLDDCATQRNLSDAGRTQAREIGAALRTQGIPIAQVLSSQYCRCLDTAELLALGDVLPEPLFNSFFDNQEVAAAQTGAALDRLLAHHNTAGTLIVVTHMVNIIALSNMSPQQGGMVVLRARDAETLQVIGELQLTP